MKLYFSPGACSLSPHIALREANLPFELERVDLKTKTTTSGENYRIINPMGSVPALQLDDGQVITENTAILSYLGRQFPQAKLWPSDPVAEARAISIMAWFSNTVHPSFTHIMRPERFTADPAGVDKIKEQGRKSFWDNVGEIDRMLAGKEWILGAQFSVCDPYALVFYGWGTRIELPMKDLKNYTAFKDRMLKRPAVHKILEREQSILLKAA